MCRYWRELSNAYFLAKFGFDTAENEPFNFHNFSSLQGFNFHGAVVSAESSLRPQPTLLAPVVDTAYCIVSCSNMLILLQSSFDGLDKVSDRYQLLHDDRGTFAQELYDLTCLSCGEKVYYSEKVPASGIAVCQVRSPLHESARD